MAPDETDCPPISPAVFNRDCQVPRRDKRSRVAVRPPGIRPVALARPKTQVWSSPVPSVVEGLVRQFDCVVRTDRLPCGRDLQVVRRLGRGRQGIVLLVVQAGAFHTHTRYALKVHDPGLFATIASYRDEMRRIAHQASALQRVHHPNLAQCHELLLFGDIGGVLMEYVQGLDLHRLGWLLGKRAAIPDVADSEEATPGADALFAGGTNRWPPGVAFYILRKVLRALEVLHNVGYIHSDIKPGNIMIDRFGTVKVIDFGRAVPASGRERLFLGTPTYMAPEVHRRRTLTPVCDLYSAGLVVLEMLRGRPVFSEDQSGRSLLRAKESLARELEAYLPKDASADGRHLAILRRLLAPTPSARFADAAEADTGQDGIRLLHDELLREQIHRDYDRLLADCMNRVLHPAFRPT
jgi:serine/threonine protein kinase